MKNKFKKVLILGVVVLLFTLPILHQTIGASTIHFSVLTAIRTDIAEKQILTPYFIWNSIVALI